jgi:hypothetical protein
MFASLAIALVALGVAIGAWLRPLAESKAAEAPTYTDQQVADAKAKVCAAYDKVHQAVLVNTGRTGGDDPTSILAMAANARVALFDGGEYLLNTLENEPATPPDLAKELQELVRAYQHLAIDYLADAPDSEVESSFNALDKPNAAVYGTCK